MAALLVTISWPYYFDLQDWDFSEFGDMAPIHEGVLMTSSLIATGGFMISTIHAVLTMCMAGELTGSVEAIYFSDRMGLANLGSFYLWILSILVFAGTLFYHFAIFAPNGWTLLVGGGTIVVMTILWIWIPLKQQKCIFDCKYLAYNTPPRKLTNQDIEGYTRKFCDKVGIDYMSEDNLTRFIELSLPHDRNTKNAPVQLATGSKSVIGKVADRLLDEYANAKAEVIINGITGGTTPCADPPHNFPPPPPMIEAEHIHGRSEAPVTTRTGTQVEVDVLGALGPAATPKFANC